MAASQFPRHDKKLVVVSLPTPTTFKVIMFVMELTAAAVAWHRILRKDGREFALDRSLGVTAR
jgi:hypothetical protein